MNCSTRWSHGLPARNAWQHLPGTYLSELMAASGVDVVTLDLQHGMIDVPAARNSLLAIHAQGASPFVRLPGLDSALICSLLDSAAEGVICPTVESAEQAAALVAAAHYPPNGRRSCGPMRANLLAQGRYLSDSLNSILTFAMIETVAGLEAVEEIARTAHLTGLFIGPADLGISMGLGSAQDRNEPEILEAFNQIKNAAVINGKRLGIHAATAAYAARMASEGFDLVTVCSDMDLLTGGTTSALTDFESAR